MGKGQAAGAFADSRTGWAGTPAVRRAGSRGKRLPGHSLVHHSAAQEVVSTTASRKRAGGWAKTSFDRMTMSASWPGASRPFCASSNDAKAAHSVRPAMPLEAIADPAASLPRCRPASAGDGHVISRRGSSATTGQSLPKMRRAPACAACAQSSRARPVRADIRRPHGELRRRRVRVERHVGHDGAFCSNRGTSAGRWSRRVRCGAGAQRPVRGSPGPRPRRRPASSAPHRRRWRASRSASRDNRTS